MTITIFLNVPDKEGVIEHKYPNLYTFFNDGFFFVVSWIEKTEKGDVEKQHRWNQKDIAYIVMKKNLWE